MIISTTFFIGTIALSVVVGAGGAELIHHLKKQQPRDFVPCTTSSNFFICDDGMFPDFHLSETTPFIHRCPG
jgi:hypothetical protein